MSSKVEAIHRAILGGGKSLDLSGTPLVTLPNEIGRLTNLELLDVSNTQLSRIPAAIGRLINLRSLDLSSTALSSLPPEVGRLGNLQTLDISKTRLGALPAEIGRLTNLQSLDLAGTPVDALPAEIGRLTNLRRLTVSSHRLSSLPAEIGRLISLQNLEVSGTRLSSLPAEIGQLTNLQFLILTSNELSTLPAEIGQLTNLRVLTLIGNQLSALPAEIGQLTNLESLDLRKNLLTVLPRRLAELPDTLSLHLGDNPLVEPFADLVDLGLRDLFAYLRSLDSAQPVYEAKVLLVGEGNVGKTSLVARLRNEDFVESRPTTHGIELGTLRLPHPTLPVHIKLNTWDFGGQEVYRITHQFFFSPRALFILVWRPREGQEENAVEGWLRRIRLRVGDDARVLLVSTYCDEREPDLDYPSLQRRYANMFCGAYAIDNRSGSGIEQFRTALAAEVARLPGMGQMVNTSWLAARDDVTSTREPQMTYAHYAALCARHGLEEAESAVLAKLLHERGVVIHYGDDDGLQDIVVVQPEWLTRAISYVLADARTKEAGGKLEHARLKEIWQERAPGQAYDAKYHPYFLRLMEKFEVSYRFPDDEKASLVAQLVPFRQPKPPWEEGAEGAHRLALVCRMRDEAPGLIPWLTVRNHRFSTGTHWRHGVFLQHASYRSRAMFKLQEDRRLLELTVNAPSPDYFFHILRDGLEYLIGQRWPGLAYAILIPCPHTLECGDSCTGHFEFSALERHRLRDIPTIRCYECLHEHSVAELLTGFAPAQIALMDVLHEQHREVMAGIRHVDTGIEQVQALASEVAGRVRIVLRVVGAEVVDCPCLFTCAPTDPRKRVITRATHEAFRITLWCEHPDRWHPWEPATYFITRPRKWLTSIAPYVRVVVRTLRQLIPVAGAVPGLFLSEHEMKAIVPELTFMEKLVAAIPEGRPGVERSIPEANQLSRAEGAALRTLRTLLLEEDRGRAFGDLRRQRTSDGTFVWICPEHYPEYDPGLPQLD